MILRHTALRTGHSPGEARVAESPSRRVAQSLILAESSSRESRHRDSARLGQPWARPGTRPAGRALRATDDVLQRCRGHVHQICISVHIHVHIHRHTFTSACGTHESNANASRAHPDWGLTKNQSSQEKDRSEEPCEHTFQSRAFTILQT